MVQRSRERNNDNSVRFREKKWLELTTAQDSSKKTMDICRKQLRCGDGVLAVGIDRIKGREMFLSHGRHQDLLIQLE